MVETVDGRFVSLGLSVLIGRPKVGKSLLALQLAGSVAQGRDFLGHEMAPGEVMLMALQDGRPRLQRRLRAQCWHPQATCRFITLEDSSEWCHRTMLELERWVTGQRLCLLIIDPVSCLPGFGRMPLSRDALLHLHKVACQHDMAILVVDVHDQTGERALAIGGVRMTLDRHFGQASGRLVVRRPHHDDLQVKLQLDPERLTWGRVQKRLGVGHVT